MTIYSSGAKALTRATLRILALAMLALGQAAQIAADPPREYDVKAAFLYNFASFVEWPAEAFPEADSPLVIGVLGRDPFGNTLDEIVAGEHTQGRPLVVHRFNRLEDMHHCHILFISSSETPLMKEILHQLRGQPVLTVGDVPGFAQMGGAVGFTTSTRVALVINPDVLKAASLSVSAKLLRLAQVVNGGNAP